MRLNFKRLKRKLIGSSPGRRKNRSNTKHKISKVYNYFCVFLIAAVLIAGLPDILDIDSGNSHKKQTSNSNTIITSTSATTTSGQASEPLEPGMMLLKAGTYKFNDELTNFDTLEFGEIATGYKIYNINFEFKIGDTLYDQLEILKFDNFPLDEGVLDGVGLSAYAGSDDTQLYATVEQAPVIGWQDSSYQTMTIPKDVVVEDDFGSWYIKSTDYNMVNNLNEDTSPQGDSLKFTSNNDGTCYVSGIGTCADTDVVIPSISPEGDSVTSIGYRAFYNCQSLTNIVIPHSVRTIDSQAFYCCKSLTSIVIPDSVRTIDSQAFLDCDSLKNVYYKGDVEGWCRIELFDSVYSFNSSNPLVNGANLYFNSVMATDITIPDSITVIRRNAFEGCNSLISVTIPGSVATIGHSAFFGCESLMSVTIPDSVVIIGHSAFFDCESLTSVTIPDSVSVIPNLLFGNCKSLASVRIGNSVTTIGSGAFLGCEQLTSITIPNSVTSIDEIAFRHCNKLTTITFEGTLEEWNAIDLYTNSSDESRNWNYRVPATHVQCTDGTVSI